jgi:transmembrane sensor
VSGQGTGGSGKRAKEREKVLLEAAEWLAIAIDNRMSTDEKSRFEAWLESSTEHREAYQRIERIWQGSGEIPEIKTRRERLTKKITRRDVGKAAILLATVGVSARYLLDSPLADFRTGQGERKTIQGADGSVFELAPLTRMSATFTDHARSVQLFQGEAYFKVSPDSRPFSVAAGKGLTRALGTAFSVKYRNGMSRIVVEEHAIQVRLGGSTAVVGAGEELAYESVLGPLRKVDPDDALAWRSGRLVFDGEPLGEVVETLNIWHAGRIVVMSDGLAQRSVTLITNTDRIGSVGAQLERALPIRVVQITPLLMFIFPAS